MERIKTRWREIPRKIYRLGRSEQTKFSRSICSVKGQTVYTGGAGSELIYRSNNASLGPKIFIRKYLAILRGKFFTRPLLLKHLILPIKFKLTMYTQIAEVLRWSVSALLYKIPKVNIIIF